MDSRMDLSALERSRLLGSLPSSALGHLGLSALAVSEQSHTSALNRLNAASAAAAAAGASPPDLARAGSPTAGLSSYPGRYLPPSALHSPGASYAMMAGYLGGGSQIPDSFKAMMPEFQQYWGTSQEAYARQLLASMYYPYLHYLPATESLSLFAQNSAAHVQAAAQAQAHAAHHRIYDLHKEALFGPGAIPGSFFPPSLLLHPPSSTGQEEATNLSVPSSSKSKYRDESDRHKHLDSLTNKPSDNAKRTDGKARSSEDDKMHIEDGSERTRGIGMRKPNYDFTKYRSSDHVKKHSPSASASTSSYSVVKAEHDRKRSKLEAVIKQAKDNGYDTDTSKPSIYTSGTYIPERKSSDKLSSPVGYREQFMPVSAFSPSHKTAFHSPTRTERVVSPNRSAKVHSPLRSHKLSSPIQISDTPQPIQDKPENLCVKDRKPKATDIVKHKDTETKPDAVIVKTQSIVTGATITVTSTLNVITSELPSPNQNKKGKREAESSPNLHSPTLSSTSTGNTTTTYSLPYYHNLYSRSQSNSQEGKKVHAVTYIPEVGTIPSPFAVSPPAKDSKTCAKIETESKSSPKLKDDNLRNNVPASKTEDVKPDGFVIQSSHRKIKTETDNRANDDELKQLSTGSDVECPNKSIKDKSSSACYDTKLLKQAKTESGMYFPKEGREKASHRNKNESVKRDKSVSQNSLPMDSKTIDLTDEKDCDLSSNCDSSKSGDRFIYKETINTRTKDGREANNKIGISAITGTAVSDAATISQTSCDVNHNSESVKETHDKDSGPRNTDRLSKQQPTTEETQEDRDDKRKITAKHSPIPTVRETNSRENPTDTKKPRQLESGKLPAFKDEKPVKFKENEKVSSKDKRNNGTSTASTIPVGIAVARQRNIAPKTDKDVQKSSDESRSKGSTSAEIKPVRPLKIIRPSSKGKPQGASDFRTELPANLIVTGGSTNNGGLFWSNDQASRQLAAQYLQPGAQINQPNWFDQSHVSFPHTNHTTTSEGSQLPFTVPPGFKLAQDSLTGGILLIPTATDVYDPSRVLSGFPVGAPNTQNFGASLLTTSQPQSNIPAAGSTFVNQPSINGSTHFPAQSFCTEVLSRPEAAVKEEKREINTQHNTDHAIITTTVGLTAGQDNGSSSMIVHQDIDKNKIMTVPPPSFVTDLSLSGGQQCAYTFHPPPAMPLIFNPSVLSVHNIHEPAPDINPLKVEQTSVQSRGTSPMLPATDSSNDEHEECSSQPDDKLEKIEEKVDDLANENDQECKSQIPDVQLDSDQNVELCTVSVPGCDKAINQDGAIETSKSVAVDQDCTARAKDTLIDSVCDKTACDIAEINNVGASVSKVSEHNIPVNNNIQPHYGKENNNDSVSLESHKDKVLTHLLDPKTDNKISTHSVTETSNSTHSANANSEMKSKTWRTSKTDRNIFSDLNEYNPFTDPQLLEATDGLELLSTLAEKSIIGLNTNPSEKKLSVKPEAASAKEDVFAFKDDSVSPSNTLNTEKETYKETIVKSPVETTKPAKSRIKCGYDFKPKQAPEADSVSPVRMTTFCGITIPEDDDVIDSIEMEMKMRLMELQKRYREKQKELQKLKPKKEREKNKEDEKGKESESDILTDAKRGRGRPKKRKLEGDDNAGKISETQTTKINTINKDVATPTKSQQSSKSHHKTQNSPHSNGTHSSHNSSNGSHGSNKKKKRAEMLVDRVFRKAGSSFKIPLSKKISLIAPARIELPGATTNNTDKTEPSHAKKTLDFRGLIKGSRLSQLNGKDRSFDGGLWERKEEKKREEKRRHSQSSNTEIKERKHKKQEVESGLGLLAEYATKYQEETNREREKTEKLKKKRKHENVASMSSPESPNKKRKPGRPKKCDLIRPGVTETIVAKQAKHMDFFRWQKDEKPERKITLEGKTPLKPLYLDEWNVRRSERIFLSDTSPQTSPNNTSASAKPVEDKEKSKDKRNDNEKGTAAKGKDGNTHKSKATKKQKSNNLKDISQKLKKKYSTTFNQKSKDKTSELLKARDKLTQKRHTKKLKKLSKSEIKDESESDASIDDLPLSTLKDEASENATAIPSCIIDKDELQDGLRILIFMDGLFHEGEVKAIRPPDVYGAILDKERRTRPHICSQEEILRDAIKDAKASSIKQLKEGTRVCAYWSQQFNCLYPGTVSRASPDPHADKSLVNVEFDDGDTGKIPIDHIRLIPQDFPIVEYDPHPLLLLTKRRRTLSTSESSEPRISCSNIPPSPKEDNASAKRGPGRPSKADRLTSVESVGDEDVFTNGTDDAKTDIDDDNKSVTSEKGTPKKQKNKQSVQANSPRQLWKWSGSSTKKPGLKGKARKEYYKCIVRGRETIMVGECAVFLSTGRPNLPYVGRIESLWEGWGGQMVVKVKWFYHPEETKGGRRLQNMKGALFRSDHEDENDVQTISHKCEVLKYEEFRKRKALISLDEMNDVYYLAGSYQPTIGHIKFEPGVI